MSTIVKRRRIPEPQLEWKAREVVRDIESRPHLFTRITLTGDYFPKRSLVPFVRVGSALTFSVEIADDSLSVRAYFAGPLPRKGIIEFGYGNEVAMRFPKRFRLDVVERLDLARLPEDIVR
jgi:hypothetical protein